MGKKLKLTRLETSARARLPAPWIFQPEMCFTPGCDAHSVEFMLTIQSKSLESIVAAIGVYPSGARIHYRRITGLETPAGAENLFVTLSRVSVRRRSKAAFCSRAT